MGILGLDKHKQEIQSAFSSNRRTWLSVAASVLALGAARMVLGATESSGMAQEVSIETFSPAGKSLGTTMARKVVKTDAEWKRQLPRISFEVTRHADTEQPYTGKDWDNHASGLYLCICCDTALFDSATKFESGTGWPSFWAPLSKANIVEHADNTFGMRRTEVLCRRCDSHLGHVFEDGPKPTGLRYCMNSASLRFTPRV